MKKEPAIAGAGRFPETSWGLVGRAGEPFSVEGRKALAVLCERYWYPVYAFVRRRGAPVEEARDLTQGFFTMLLDRSDIRSADPGRGRFRTWLLACVKHYLANEAMRARALKRGGGQVIHSFDASDAERRYRAEPAQAPDPEWLFERRFTLLVLERVLDRLRDRYAGAGQERVFDALKGRLTSDGSERPHHEVASELGTTVEAVKTATSRLYDRYAKILREEVASTVARPEEIDDEIRYMLATLGDDPG
jgi:RNA polymerase sigma-70 factor (ECF subfamily)